MLSFFCSRQTLALLWALLLLLYYHIHDKGCCCWCCCFQHQFSHHFQLICHKVFIKLTIWVNIFSSKSKDGKMLFTRVRKGGWLHSITLAKQVSLFHFFFISPEGMLCFWGVMESASRVEELCQKFILILVSDKIK